MTSVLVMGVALWWAAHLFKRVLPGPRAAMGDAGRGVVAVALLVSVGLMIWGYRGAEGAVYWGRHPATVGINNLLVLGALFLMSPAPRKGRLFNGMRHPMLTGMVLWGVAHLLVNGDVPSFILFGGLTLWALVEMAVINRAEGDWTPGPAGTYAKDGMFLVASVVLMGVIGMIHTYLGYSPFG